MIGLRREWDQLVLVRHGESAGNVARTAALAAGAHVIDIDRRDADVPLTEVGLEQARAVGAWLRDAPAPDVVFSSPYVRAEQTASQALRSAGVDTPIEVDERLRDRELGILDLLTHDGVVARFPEEEARRAWLGKLYYRPPGGESWADVVLRLRSFLTDAMGGAGEAKRALIVTHDAVIMLVRYILEGWDEQTLLETAARTEIANASVTVLTPDPGGSPVWLVKSFNAVEHLGVPAQHDDRSMDERS